MAGCRFQPTDIMAISSDHTSVLRGLKVLDFTAMIAGPYCTRWLADLGAEVIKVEPPEGDHMRHRSPLRGDRSAYFGHLNAGKKCIALDLKMSSAVAIAQQLAKQSDLVVEAFRPGVMERSGLRTDTLRSANPRLIYCSISGFGQNSELSQRSTYAPVVHASSGFDWAQGQDEHGRPLGSNIPMADFLTAMFAFMALQNALMVRGTTDSGTFIDVNLMDSLMNFMPYEFQAAKLAAQQPRPRYKPLKARDGYVLVTPINARNFRHLCDALGHPEWMQDPMLSTDAARFANWAEYMRRIEAWTSERTAAECETVLTQFDVPCARYRHIGDSMKDEQFDQRDSFASICDGPQTYWAAKLPFSFEGLRPSPGHHVSAHGSETAAVLIERLNLSQHELQALRREGSIICQP